MNKLLITLAALPIAALATDASAQPRYGIQNDTMIETRIDNIEARLEAGIDANAIDRRQARELRRQVTELRQLEARYSVNGFNRTERTELQTRTRSLRENVRVAANTRWSGNYGWAENDFDRSQAYDTRYGSNDRYDRYDRQAPRDSYETDRYGNRIYTGQGGPYEPATRERPSIGDVLSNLVNGRRLDRVPDRYSTEYRDTSNVYFRSDGESVYEIDARTNRVIRIHPMR